MTLADRFSVILVRPTESGNVGSTARAMANTGLARLILVEPAAPIDRVARAFAVGAGEILDSAVRVQSLAEALGPFQRVVGTTSTRNRELDIPIVDERTFAARAVRETEPVTTAVVFGPERSGLNNEELALCGELVRIPTAPEQPTLNLGQAVLLVGHALYLAFQSAKQESGGREGRAAAAMAPSETLSISSSESSSETPGTSRDPHAEIQAPQTEPPAPTAEVEGLFQHVNEVLEKVGFTRDDTAAGVLRDLRHLSARAGLTSREIQILRGICRRTLSRLG